MTPNVVPEHLLTKTPLVTRWAMTQEPIRRVPRLLLDTLRCQDSLVGEEDVRRYSDSSDRLQYTPADDHRQRAGSGMGLRHQPVPLRTKRQDAKLVSNRSVPMTHVHVAICVARGTTWWPFSSPHSQRPVMTISYDLIQMVGNVGSWACSSTCQTRFTSDRRNCVAHTPVRKVVLNLQSPS